MGTENKRRVINTHERAFTATADQVGALVATLASRTDRLWPHEHWPRMRLDNGLSVGSSGGHGPVSYCIERIEVQTSADAETTNNEAAAIRKLAFRFTKPNGFDGIHSFAVLPRGRTTVLIHDLRMQPRGWARLTWPIFFRPSTIPSSKRRSTRPPANSTSRLLHRTGAQPGCDFCAGSRGRRRI